MPYNINRVPDTPMTPGMLPPATELHDSDIVIVIQPVNDPGQKTRTTTLSQLAGYIAGGGVSSITFTGENGYTATASGEGFNYHKDATQEDQAARDFGIDDDGIHATVTTSNYTKKFEVLPDEVKYSKTAGGLTNKVEIFEDYVLITHQVQNGATVETHTSRIGWDSMRAPVLNVMQDENNNIPISWDVTNGELVIWRRANSGKVAVPKLHVYGTLEVEKDSKLKGDVDIDKTLDVTGEARFADKVIVAGNAIFNGGVTGEYYGTLATINVEMDTTKNASIIKCSISANPTLPSDAPVGRRVIVVNDTSSTQTVTMGASTKTINAYEAAEFIRATSDTTMGWYPLS